MTYTEKLQFAKDLLDELQTAGYDPAVSEGTGNTLDDLTEQELDDLLNYESYKLKRPKPIPHI